MSDHTRTTTTATSTATVASLVLAVAVLVAYLLTGGAPNPGMAAIALFPLLAAWASRSGRRWWPFAALAAAGLAVALRPAELSFDLVRPGGVVPFVVAATTVLAAGALAAAAVVRLVRLPGRLAVGGAPVLGAAAAAGLLLLSPQTDDTGGLSEEEIAALPTVEMTNFKFLPGQLRVAQGQQVAFRFVNDTDDSHSFAVDAFDLDVLVPSGRSRVVVVEPDAGVHPFHCSVGSHREDGMEGTLTVVGTEDAVDTEGGTAHQHEDQSADQSADQPAHGEPGHDHSAH